MRQGKLVRFNKRTGAVISINSTAERGLFGGGVADGVEACDLGGGLTGLVGCNACLIVNQKNMDTYNIPLQAASYARHRMDYGLDFLHFEWQ